MPANSIATAWNRASQEERHGFLWVLVHLLPHEVRRKLDHADAHRGDTLAHITAVTGAEGPKDTGASS